jgi:flagellar basal body P-ring formation protein FlgA
MNSNPLTPANRFNQVCRCLFACLLLMAPFSVPAQGRPGVAAPGVATLSQSPAASGQATLTRDVARIGIGPIIEAFLTFQTRQMDGQVEFDVGSPDPNLSLAPCNTVEPFIPSGTRLWGKSRLGLRCTDGARWTVTVPLNVRVTGRALVAARALAPGQPLSDGDLIEADAELTSEPGTPLRPGVGLEFRALTRAVAAGTVIREDWLRALPVVSQGEIVKMTVRGNGFAISADGVALNNAIDGGQVRIRTENGRTVSGIARPGKVAEIRL